MLVSSCQQADAETIKNMVLHPDAPDRDPLRQWYIEAGGVPMKYKIALQKSDAGFSVSVPGLPGCWSQGATEEEAGLASDDP